MGAPFFSFRDLAYTHPHASRPCFHGLSGDAHAGEWICVAGPNGAGKSTLLRLLAGLRRPGRGSVGLSTARGTVHPGDPDFRLDVAYLAQSPHEQLIGRTVFDELAAGLEWRGVPPAEIRSRVAVAADRLGLEPGAEVAALSHGRRHALALAGATLPDARLVIADEPLAGLDPDARAAWLESAAQLRSQGRTLITAGVSAAEASHADRAWLLRAGAASLEQVTPASLLETGAARRAGLRPAAAAARLAADPPAAPSPAGPFIRVEHLVPRRGGRDLSAPLDMEIPPAGLVGIWGPNGCGKTTLAMTLAGLLPADGARITGALGWTGRGGARTCWSALAFENAEDQSGEGSVAEELTAGDPRNARCLEEGRAALDRLGLGDPAILERSPWRLSGGERRRVALAALAAVRPGWLLLDEPFGGLDGEGCERLSGWLREASAARATWVFSADYDAPEVPAAAWRVFGAPGMAPFCPAPRRYNVTNYLPWAYGYA